MEVTRREFTRIGCKVIIGAAAGSAIIESVVTNGSAAENSPAAGYDWNEHFWGYVVDTRICIGCLPVRRPGRGMEVTEWKRRIHTHYWVT